jgi:hypothetical protein
MPDRIKIEDRLRNLEAQVFDGPNVNTVPRTTDPVVQNLYRRLTIAEINAGATLLAALTGFRYRLVDVTLIAIGGNAATATAVVINATQAGSAVALITAAVAALTRSAVVKPNSANVTVLADGASLLVNDHSTAIAIAKTGSALATATHVDVILSYTIEAAA